MWAAGALAMAVMAVAPATAWAWPCSVEIEKTVAIDEDCDGHEDGEFVDSVSQEIDQCVVYRFCVANTGQQDLSGVRVRDTLFTGDEAYWETLAWSSPGPTVSCYRLPAHPFNFMPPCVVDPETDMDYCKCDWVAGTSTATITEAVCAETGQDACAQPLSDCDDPATVACVEGGCLTRSPGFWGNHPDLTEEILDVTSCGVTLSETAAGLEGSVTEDLCSLGGDKTRGSRQSAQLVRQCAAAALNMAASARFGGSCTQALTPARFEACCGSASACASVPANCIDDLDAFNESQDSLLDGLGRELSLCRELGLGPSCEAEPLQCRIAKRNGFVNTR